MKNIIATWICVDTETNSTYFPSAKGKSSDAKVQNIYWRCICCFYTIARNYNPDTTLALFSNTSYLPVVDDVDIKQLLQQLNVSFYVTPFEYVTPQGYYNQWRNQFYEFSIFKFISTHEDFNVDDNFLLLDSDCIITQNLSSLFAEVAAEKCITYIIDYLPDHDINGNSRKSMQNVFSSLMNEKTLHIPQYHAGEFYATTIAVLRTLINDFYIVWKQLLALNEAGLDKLHEEAHTLSYLFYKNNFEGGQANKYIKRLWTDPTTFRNIENGDENLAIWHLPAEKRHGFPALFEWLKKRNFNLSSVTVQQLQQRLQSNFMIPVIPAQRRPYFAGKALMKKVFSK